MQKEDENLQGQLVKGNEKEDEEKKESDDEDEKQDEEGEEQDDDAEGEDETEINNSVEIFF